MSRRPVDGDVIFYQLYTDSGGKTKAINARIEGVSFVKPHKKSTPKQEKNTFLGMSSQCRLLVVSHTERSNAIRIISARIANPNERGIYENG